jgi:hypothetical protein
MFKRLSLLLPLLLLCVLLTPSQPAFARFNSLPDFFGLSTTGPNTSSWPVDADATCTTITVSLAYPSNDNPFGVPDPYDSVTWSLEKVLVNGTQEVSVVESDKTIYTFAYGTPGGEGHSKTFTLTTPLEAGTGLFVKVRYQINGGELGGGTSVFDVGDFDHPYWHMRAYEPSLSPSANQHFCTNSSAAPNIYVLGDVARNEGNGGSQTYLYKLFLDKPTNKPVRVDLESLTAAGLAFTSPTFPSFNGYSSRGIQYGNAVCVDGGVGCITPTYTTITIPAGVTQVDLPVTLGSDTTPAINWYGLHHFSIIRVANAKFGGHLSGVLATRNDDGCNGFGPPGACFVNLTDPNGTTYPDIPADKYSFVVANQTVSETAGTVTFPVTLTQAAEQTVTINYQTTSAEGYNATAGVDYTPTSGTLTFAPGVLSQNVVVQIAANPEAEVLEAFGLKVAKTNAISSDEVTVGALILDYVAPPTNTPTSTETNTPTSTATATSTATPTSTPITPPSTQDVTPFQTPTPTDNPPVGEEQELLVNGDFELKDSKGKPNLAPWKIENGSEDNIKCNKAAKIFARTGTCAFKFQGAGSEDSVLSQKVEVENFNFTASDQLTLNAYVDAKHAPKGKLKVVVKYTNDAIEKSKLEVDLQQTNGYQLLTGNLTLASGDVDNIKVMINHRTTSGKVYVDTVRLIQTSPTPLIPLP